MSLGSAVKTGLAGCAAAFTLGALAMAQQSEEYLAYLAELEKPGPQWVVISYHFRHGDGCTTYGCVIVGPTNDEDACRNWSRLYNRGAIEDHSRCVMADPYALPQY